jgi:acyl phosphate:glycerol-3-phosphate acyltransferase
MSLVAIIFGYLLGSIPFGLVLTRIAGTEDLRSIGSGNIGATNVLRTGRKGLAAATLVLDALKGTIAVWLGAEIAGADGALMGGMAAFLGHLFPVWLNFRGGKGVATFLGVILGLDWAMFLFAALVWLIVAYAKRYSSLASLWMSGLVPVVYFIDALIFRDPTGQKAIGFAVLSALLWWKHAENIKRLRAGTESKIGQK